MSGHRTLFIALVFLLTAVPMGTAAETCLTASSSEQLAALENETGVDMSPVFADMCTRDAAMREAVKDSINQRIDKFEQRQQDNITALRADLLSYIDTKLSKEDDLAHAMQRIAAINNRTYNMEEREKDIRSDYQDRIAKLRDELNRTRQELRSFKDKADRQYATDTELTDVKNRLEGQVVRNSGVTGMLPRIPRTYAFVLLIVALLIFLKLWFDDHPRIQPLKEFLNMNSDAEDLTQEEIEALKEKGIGVDDEEDGGETDEPDDEPDEQDE